MKIKYYLTKNTFEAPKGKGYVARVEKPGILYQEDLINAMAGNNTVFSRQDIRCVLDLMNETVQEKVFSGYSVYTDLFRADVSIRGGFESPDDRFDPQRHHVAVNMKASLAFKKRATRKSQVMKIIEQYVVPSISAVEKLGKNRDREGYVPGDMLELKGYALKREDGHSPVYLLPAKEGTEWERDRISLEVFRVYDRSVLCRLPESLKSGSYHILVDSCLDGNRSIAEYERPLEITNPTDNSQG